MTTYSRTHLDQLESEAIFVMREVAAQFERPALLFSGGKDSITERDEEDYDDRGLPIRLMPPHLAWLDRTLYGTLRAESRFLANPDHALPFGSALLFSAINPGGPASEVGSAHRVAETA